MLTSLMIKNLALIEELTIEFKPQLNILSGETGAGKSIAIGALQLLTGKRAEKSIIRTDADECRIQAIFEIGDSTEIIHQVNDILTEAGIDPCNDGQLLISRRISEKSVRNYINTTPVTLHILKSIGELILDIHGPYDNQSLLKASHQLDLLDAFAGLKKQRQSAKTLYMDWRQKTAALVAAKNENPSSEMIDFLKFQVQEIESAQLLPDEDSQLGKDHKRAANSHEISSVLNQSMTKLSDDDDSLLDQLGDLLKDCIELERFDSDNIKVFSRTLESVIADLQDLNLSMADYARNIDLDPEAFQQMEARLSVIQSLKRKYGGSIESIQLHLETAKDKLLNLEDYEAHIQRLESDIEKALGKLHKVANKLSLGRRKSAAKLSAEIQAKLKLLGFPNAEFDIAIEDCELSATGSDLITFIFAPNPGEGKQPLKAIASSGEIARVMLAIKTVLAEADHTPLLIFDEVDANIGGVTAGSIAKELNNLGKSHQVICITHQAQVAAGGNTHFLVSKKSINKRTTATIRELKTNDRIDELVRMLGGGKNGSAVHKHAKELLEK